VKDIRKTLDDGFLIDADGQRKDLTPEMRKQLKEFLEMLKAYVGELNVAFGLTAKQWSEVADKAFQISGLFDSAASSVEGLSEGLADTLRTLGDIVSISGNVANAIAGFAKGPEGILQGITGIVGAIGGIFSLGKAARESRRKAEQEMQAFQLKQMQGELEIDALLRERELSMARINKLRLEGMRAEKELLLEQKKLVEEQYNDILKQLQEQSYIVGQTTEKYGGILGAGRKTRVVNIQQTIGNQSFEELEALNAQGRLIGKAKELFDMLVKIKEEGNDIDELLARNQQEAAELFTGTTVTSISDAIIEGFKAGKRGAADFADDFQGLMQQALLQSLQFRYLEGPLTDFFNQFADLTQSGEQLDAGEIERLQQMYNAIITNAASQFDQLQDIANLNFSGTGSGGNSLTGAIQGMTEQQAELLAGQFGGMRLTMIEQLKVAESGLKNLQNIENNTFQLHEILRLWKRVEINGLKVV
ncbi:MAG: hypothetical protein J7527_16150, partial [Chitinophagaceae bacterium]|nr:hypothetical protein [Chitinophagaceae bacterium]